MLGWTFKGLREFQAYELLGKPENKSRHEELWVGPTACTALGLCSFSVDRLRFLSCPNLRTHQWEHSPEGSAIDDAALISLRDFLCHCPYLQKLVILISYDLELDSLIQFVFCDAQEQGVWRYIESVEVKVSFFRSDRYHFFSKTVGRQQVYEK